MRLLMVLFIAAVAAKKPANPCQLVCAKAVETCEKAGYKAKKCFEAIHRCDSCENPKP